MAVLARERKERGRGGPSRVACSETYKASLTTCSMWSHCNAVNRRDAVSGSNAERLVKSTSGDQSIQHEAIAKKMNGAGLAREDLMGWRKAQLVEDGGADVVGRAGILGRLLPERVGGAIYTVLKTASGQQGSHRPRPVIAAR